jgi:hypothetical protein
MKQDEENEQFLEHYITNKLDYLEWTSESEIKVSPVMLEIAKEFLKLPFEDCSNIKGYRAVRKIFHHIANDIIFRTVEAGKLSDDILNKTSDKYGVSPRRVLIVFEALKLAGWKPRQIAQTTNII